MDSRQLAHRFELHPPTSPEVISAHEQVRARFAEIAEWVNQLLPEGREKSQALTALDDGCMYSNASIARTQLQRRIDAERS